MSCTVVILAAGKGTRTQFPTPKILLPLGGKPIISHIIDNTQTGTHFPIIVVTRRELVKTIEEAHPDVTIIPQDISNGTGGALQMALPYVKTKYLTVVLGDTPLISSDLKAHQYWHTVLRSPTRLR